MSPVRFALATLAVLPVAHAQVAVRPGIATTQPAPIVVAPDVAKTPTPGGPVPIPYPNVVAPTPKPVAAPLPQPISVPVKVISVVPGKPDHAGKPPHAGKPDGAGKPDWGGKPEGAGKPLEPGRPGWAGKPDGAGKPEWAGKPEVVGKPDRPRLTPLDDLPAKKDPLKEASELDQKQLQDAMDKKSRLEQAASDLLKKSSDTQQTITQNIK
jgi:hypothetical protein